MELKDEIISILKRHLIEPKINLEVNEMGRVGGYVVSKTFDDVDQVDRQDRLWEFLEKELPKEKQHQIIAILTLTPDEAGLPA